MKMPTLDLCPLSLSMVAEAWYPSTWEAKEELEADLVIQ